MRYCAGRMGKGRSTASRIQLLLTILTMVLWVTPVVIQAQPKIDPVTLVATLHSSLNAHDSAAALTLFTTDAVIYDPHVIVCPWPITRAWPLCRWPFGPKEAQTGNTYVGTAQIRGWLEWLTQQNVVIKQLKSVQVIGDNASWTFELTLDYYRNIVRAPDPLVATAQALSHGGKFRFLAVDLTPQSNIKVVMAATEARRAQLSATANGIVVGMFALAVIIPVGVVGLTLAKRKRLWAKHKS
jgi:hypothetical protein